MSYISVVLLAASYQSLSQLWSLFKQNFPWKPTWGVFGIVLLLRGASLSSFKQVEKETKDELRSKEHKGRMQSSPDSWPPTGAVMKLSLGGAFETWTIAPVLLFRKKNHVSQNVILAKFTEPWPEVQWRIRIISVDILTDPNMYRHQGLQNEGNTSQHERSFPAR